MRNKLLLGQEPNLHRKGRPLGARFVLFIISLPILVLKGVLAMITEMTRPTYPTRSKYASPVPPAQQIYTPNAASQAVVSSLQDKLGQSLFQVSIRAVAITNDNSRATQSLTGITAALAAFQVPGYQGFNIKRNFPKRWRMPYRWLHFANRLPSEFMKADNILSVAEVASLYHFPYGDGSTSTENTIRSYSRTLPAPASLKAQADNHDFDVILGVNRHHGSDTLIGLTQAERERHIYVVGGTGNGKTTMLQYAIVQDIAAGRGVAVVDPHGDLAETILKYIPEERIKDVIYLNPQDIEHPIGLNLLELPVGLTEGRLALEQDFVTEAIVSIFRKTFSEDDTGGHRIEYILRNTIHTAFTVPGATLFTLYDLLTDTEFRNSVTSKLKDARLKQFWDNEFAKAGNMQRVKMASGVTNKLGRFDRSAVVKRVMEQTTSTIDFDEILASNKILICNFAKGGIGEDTAALFGITVLAKLQLAALRRARMTESERTPFYLYVDEFQHFATPSFLQMLSEARKYKLFLTMAEQSTAQQEKQQVYLILDNVGTVISFRVRAASEQLLLPNFQPHLQAGEIASLAAYHYYIRINGLETHEPVSGETIVLEDVGDESMAERVKLASREEYGREYTEPVKQAVQEQQQPQIPKIKSKPKQTDKKNGKLIAKSALKHKKK